jgi:hypothetical protein
MPGTPQFVSMQGFPQYLAAPTPAPTAPVPSQFGAPRLPHPATPWGSSINFTPGASSSMGVSGAYVLPSTDGRDQGDVVTGTVSVDSFDAHAPFDSGARFFCLFRRILWRLLVFWCRRWVTQLWLVLLRAPLVAVQSAQVVPSFLLMRSFQLILW